MIYAMGSSESLGEAVDISMSKNMTSALVTWL